MKADYLKEKWHFYPVLTAHVKSERSQDARWGTTVRKSPIGESFPLVWDEKFPSNRELSSARAANMIYLLIEDYGISASRLAVVGYVDTKTVAVNDSPENWQKTSRVVIYIKEL